MCHAGLCVTWAPLRRAGSLLPILSPWLESPSLANLSPAQVCKQTIPKKMCVTLTSCEARVLYLTLTCVCVCVTEGSGSGNLSTSSSCSETYTSFSDIKSWTPLHFLHHLPPNCPALNASIMWLSVLYCQHQYTLEFISTKICTFSFFLNSQICTKYWDNGKCYKFDCSAMMRWRYEKDKPITHSHFTVQLSDPLVIHSSVYFYEEQRIHAIVM